VSRATEQAPKEEMTTIDQVGPCAASSEHEHLDRALQSLSAGIARLERKFDRILALAIESRPRSRL
jgi:hypothetical protein